ncbi:MAG: L-iditol 2-dehydrogenase [Tepidanaerobacteraceae bacterium]|nr:L-iditol 2-dehydrogenase [Tepidanaerobacteraceae bacterium]
MKAAFLYGPKDLRFKEMEVPVPGPGEVVIKPKVALTCGTDVKQYMRGYPLLKPPFPFGHEASGVVLSVGEGVSKFAVGDRVVAHATAPCNTCYYCKKGQHSMCENFIANQGAFAEAWKIPKAIVDQNMFKIPDNLPFADAALLEPLSCATYGIEESNIHLGDTVVVNGAGPIGLLFVKLATLKGAKVIVSDMSEKRLALAKKLGASEIVNVTKVTDQVKAVIDLTEEKRGVDVAIEAIGLPETWEKTIAMARRGGTVLLFGGPPGGTTITIETQRLHYSQLTIKGVFNTTPRHVLAAFELLKQRVITAADFVGNEYRLEDLEKAILNHKEGNVIKNAILFD